MLNENNVALSLTPVTVVGSLYIGAQLESGGHPINLRTLAGEGDDASFVPEEYEFILRNPVKLGGRMVETGSLARIKCTTRQVKSDNAYVNEDGRVVATFTRGDGSQGEAYPVTVSDIALSAKSVKLEAKVSLVDEL